MEAQDAETAWKTGSKHDILHTAFLLQNKVGHDVVGDILRHADQILASASTKSFSPDLCVALQTAPQEVFTTPPIETTVRRARPIERVTFAITSHDQGTVSDPDRGNWTWFTAAIFKPGEEDDDGSEADHDAGEAPPPDPTALAGPAPILRRGPPRLPRGPLQGGRRGFPGRQPFRVTPRLGVPPPEPRELDPKHKEREVCKNKLGHGEHEPKTVVWRAEADDADEAAWVTGLENGDRIRLYAWARFPGWRNYVREATITVHSPAIVG